MSNEEMVLLIQAGQREYMEQLYFQNRSFIYQIASRYQGLAEMEDLLQEGFLALYDAVAGYDSDQGVKFLTYAEHWLKQRFRRYLDNHSTVCRVPIGRRGTIWKYQRFISDFGKEHNRKPTDQEVGCHFHLDRDQVQQLKKDLRMVQMDSLDRPIGSLEDDGLMLGDSVPDPSDWEEDVLDRLQREQMCREVWGCVDSLEERQANVIRQRYQDNMTLDAVAADQGVTRERVRQIQITALRELRKPSNAKRLKPYVEEFIMADAYRSGVESFHRTWTSSTERTALRLLEELQRCRNQQK